MISWLATQSQCRPDEPAFGFEGTTYTYGELGHEAQSRAAYLADRGIGPGDKVGLMARNSPDWIFSLHAILWRGATVVPLHFRATSAELEDQLADIDVEFVIGGESLRALPASEKGVLFEALSRSDGVNSQPVQVAPNQVATVLFTSGTTGRAKKVPLTFDNHSASAVASALRLGRHDDDHWLCCLPLCHIGGLAIVLRSVIYGTSFELCRGFEATRAVELLATRRITLASFVPTMLHRVLATRTGLFDTDLRALLIGGGPIRGEALRQARKRGLPVAPSFGMTEAASQLTTLSPEAPEHRLDSAGRALRGVELHIQGRGGLTASPGEPGMIWVRGPMVSETYLDNNERPGWYCTGDVGAVDEQGFLSIHHRLTERIVTGGENVDPGEVEEVLREVPEVLNAAVVGIDDEQWGQIVAAAVAVGDGLSPQIVGALQAHCRQTLAGFKIPRRWKVVDELPTTAAGKLRRTSIRELFNDTPSDA